MLDTDVQKAYDQRSTALFLQTSCTPPSKNSKKKLSVNTGLEPVSRAFEVIYETRMLPIAPANLVVDEQCFHFIVVIPSILLHWR